MGQSKNQASSCYSIQIKFRNWSHQTRVRQGAWDVVQVKLKTEFFETLPDFLYPALGIGLEDSSV